MKKYCKCKNTESWFNPRSVISVAVWINSFRSRWWVALPEFCHDLGYTSLVWARFHQNVNDVANEIHFVCLCPKRGGNLAVFHCSMEIFMYYDISIHWNFWVNTRCNYLYTAVKVGGGMGQARVLATTEMTHCRVKSTVHMLNQPPHFLNVANFISDAFAEWSCYCGYQRCNPHTMLTNSPKRINNSKSKMSECLSNFFSLDSKSGNIVLWATHTFLTIPIDIKKYTVGFQFFHPCRKLGWYIPVPNQCPKLCTVWTCAAKIFPSM